MYLAHSESSRAVTNVVLNGSFYCMAACILYLVVCVIHKERFVSSILFPIYWIWFGTLFVRLNSKNGLNTHNHTQFKVCGLTIENGCLKNIFCFRVGSCDWFEWRGRIKCILCIFSKDKLTLPLSLLEFRNVSQHTKFRQLINIWQFSFEQYCQKSHMCICWFVRKGINLIFRTLMALGLSETPKKFEQNIRELAS